MQQYLTFKKEGGIEAAEEEEVWLGMVGHASTQHLEAEAAGSQVKGHPGLHSVKKERREEE